MEIQSRKYLVRDQVYRISESVILPFVPFISGEGAKHGCLSIFQISFLIPKSFLLFSGFSCCDFDFGHVDALVKSK